MNVRPLLFAALVPLLFFGTTAGFKSAGVWSVSGKLTASGERIQAIGTSVSEIKGWMTLGEVARAFGLPAADIVTHFRLPAGTPDTAQLKSLESEEFSVTGLRTWITEQTGVK